jgi:hypothetical protein
MNNSYNFIKIKIENCLSIFSEAKYNESRGFGYQSRRVIVIWENKSISWNWLSIEYGIRWTNKLQIFPIWNGSDNNKRSLIIGIWKLYFQIIYNRSKPFNQNRKLFMRRKLWNFYRLVA